MTSTTEKFLWVCELTKEKPTVKWASGDAWDADEEDKDYAYSSLILKTAMLGTTAVEGERNVVMLKAKGHPYKKEEINQPLFSLTNGKVDTITNFDLTVAHTRGEGEIEFTLTEGTGPLFITCTHLVELPLPSEETILTADDMEETDEDEEVEEEESEEMSEETKKITAMKKKATNGKNGHAKKEELVEELPAKRKRN